MIAELTKFENLLVRKNNPVGTSLLLILAWIACSDDDLDKRELEELNFIAESSNHQDELPIIIEILQNSDYDSIQLACEIIKTHVEQSKANLFLEMCIGIAIADGRLKVTENYILRFIADLFNMSQATLNNIFQNITTKDFPEPEDFSSYKYWNYSEYKSNRDNGNREQRSASISKQKALAILGLEDGASLEEIKNTYRRLAQIHHPDKYFSLGEEAVQAATITFKRITNAYNYLIKHA